MYHNLFSLQNSVGRDPGLYYHKQYNVVHVLLHLTVDVAVVYPGLEENLE